MACVEFVPKSFSEESCRRIDQCNEIIEEYMDDNLRLTLRQLYYQFVSKDLIPNSDRSYTTLGKLVSNARLAGLIDWDAIEDRGRVPDVPKQWDSIEDIMKVAMEQFRLPRWDDQDSYVELWVEKQALAGVLKPLADKWHVTLMVNKGYSSQSAMHESAGRFKDHDRPGVLLYLGDHDPSGEDMVRDIRDRLSMFGSDVDVRKVALTMSQIEQYEPPPNPTKLSDSRAKAYIEKFGRSSWEVDALPPRVLASIIEWNIKQHVDVKRMNAVIKREATDKKKLKLALARIQGA